MKQSFTSISLVKYLYNETTASETLAIQEALRESAEFRQEFQEMRQAYRQLPKVSFIASRSSLKSILDYSKQNAFEEQC